MPRDRRYSTARWRKLRAKAIREAGGRCAVAGCRADMSQPRMTHVDHIVELRDGGDFWDPLNLQVVCRFHHFEKSVSVGAARATGGGRASGGKAPPRPYCQTFMMGRWEPASPHGIECDAPGVNCPHEKYRAGLEADRAKRAASRSRTS